MAHMEIGDRYHGDQAALPGMLDFAVNVRGSAPPAWLVDELSGGLTDLGRYPGGELERRAVAAVAARHHRPVDEVLLLAGGAEGFGLLPNLAPRRVALIAPSFTEPAAVFAAWGIDHRHVILPPPFRLGDARVPDDADLVVVGARGVGGFRGLLLGSLAHQVAVHAPCPAVVVPPADPEP